MIVTEIDIDLRCEPADVFALISDMERNPSWQNGMKSCEWLTDPPHGVGSRYLQKAEFMRRPIDSTFEVIEFEAGRCIKATTVESTFPITFTRRVTPIGDGMSRVQALIEGDSSGVFRIMEPLLAPLVRRSIRADYRRLKELCEA